MGRKIAAAMDGGRGEMMGFDRRGKLKVTQAKKYFDFNASQFVFMHSRGSNRPPFLSRSKICWSKNARSGPDILFSPQ